MKLIVNNFRLAFLALILTAATAEAADQPLMTINFNQKVVTYQNQLFLAVREAVKVKPTVIFNVVDITASGNGQHGKQVAADIARIGVNPTQITYQPQVANSPGEIVQIFVR